MKILNAIKKEASPFLLLLGAILLSPILILGIPYNIIKAIYHSKGYKGWTLVLHIIKYWANILYQIWVVIKYITLEFAIIIDLLGNVLIGEIIEDCVTPEEKTYYGKGECTISMATGDIEARGKKQPSKITPLGIKFVKFLNFFEYEHCSKALRKWKYNQKLKQEKRS